MQPSQVSVSIALPTYNRADLLPAVIESILSQDYSDFELLIVDDGSTDNTAELIAEIARRDTRVRYIPLPQNRGLGNARMVGIEQSTGKYIALADSDDQWVPGRLKMQVEVLNNHPEIDLLFGNFLNIDHIRGIILEGFDDTQAGMAYLTTRQVEDDLWIIEKGFEQGFLRDDFVAAPTALIRAEVFKKVGNYNPNLKFTDHEFFWRAAVLGTRFAYQKQMLIKRYRLKTSMTAQITAAVMGEMAVLDTCRQTCHSAHHPDLIPYVSAAQQRAWRKLLFYYGSQNAHGKVLKAYLSSFKYGFSLRTLVFFVTALGGTPMIRLWTKIRSRFSHKQVRENG